MSGEGKPKPRPAKDETKGARGRTGPGTRMVGTPVTPGRQNAEDPTSRRERLRAIARGEGKR